MRKDNFTEATLTMSGEFLLQVIRPDGSCREEKRFSNLILDNGINRLTSGLVYVIDRIFVGTGSSEPNVSQTQLDNLLATSTSKQSSYPTNATSEPWSTTATIRYRFGVGQATGNISEVGVGWLDGIHQCFSRELVRDGLGNPTTITILADEILDVTYIYKLNIPSGIFETTAVLGPSSDTGITTAATLTTLTDDTKVWTVDEWIGYRVRIVSGTGEGQIRTITGNTVDTLTVSADWDITPVGTISDYEISEFIHICQIRAQNVTSTTKYAGKTPSSVEGCGWNMAPGTAYNPMMGLTMGKRTTNNLGGWSTEMWAYADDVLAPINGTRSINPMTKSVSEHGNIPIGWVGNGNGTTDLWFEAQLDDFNPAGTDETDYLGRVTFRGGYAGGASSTTDFIHRNGIFQMSWNAVFFPRIRKDNSKILRMTFRITFARQGELPA